jgi:hypothetical protein
MTGWQFASSEDARPSHQYCYVRNRMSGTGEIDIYIADTHAGVHPYNQTDMAPLTRADYDDALPKCTWTPGTVLPVPERSPRGRAA